MMIGLLGGEKSSKTSSAILTESTIVTDWRTDRITAAYMLQNVLYKMFF